MEMRTNVIVTMALIFVFIAVSATTASAIPCNCGDICVNETGWWRDDAAFNASGTPIQTAIYNATAGDSIYVYNGSYTENVNVDKRLTLQGEGRDVVTVTAVVTSDHVFEVTANTDYVNISGFTVENATGSGKAGIYLGDDVEHCNISSNNVTNNIHGIYLYSSSNNNLSGNNAYDNSQYGIYLSLSNYNNLSGNNAYNNSNGICLQSLSNNNNLSGNTAYDNSQYGIYLYSSSNNNLSGNNAYNSSYGIYLYPSSNNNNLSGNNAYNNSQYGIYLHSSSSNSLSGNNAYNNFLYGIYLYSSSSNSLSGNNAYNNSEHGIFLEYSSNNNLTNNTASSNTNYDFYSDENSHSNTVKDLTISSYPTTISFTYDNGIKIKGVTTPEPDPADKINISKYVNATSVTANSWLFLNVSYSDADVRGVVAEGSLLLYRWNGTASAWELANETGQPNGANTAENYVYANVTGISQIAPFGNPPAPPIAEFTYSPSNPVVNQTITFNASGSSDPDGGTITNYEWNFSDGTTGTGEIITHSYSSAGSNYIVNLTVTANSGLTNSTSKPITVYPVAMVDTGPGTYPSIRGTHNGTIKVNETMKVSRMYTYPCFKTDGHSEFVAFYNSTSTTGEEIANGTWIGTYLGAYQWITFDKSFTLKAGVTYNYTIRTGCYPQIIHNETLTAADGTIITCTEFVDANGKIYTNWIPAIRLEGYYPIF